MEFLILGPLTKLAYTIDWLEVETDQGNFVICPGHAPMILLLAVNKEVIFSLSNGKQDQLLIKNGILAIDRLQATLFINE